MLKQVHGALVVVLIYPTRLMVTCQGIRLVGRVLCYIFLVLLLEKKKNSRMRHGHKGPLSGTIVSISGAR